MKAPKSYPVPSNEASRLKALYAYDILDTISEEEYDSITKIAAQICNVPVSLITFLDKDRQWFKSHLGTEVTGTPREMAFCNHTILNKENVLVVPDLRNDERFAENPLITGDPHVVFYAGAPLVTPSGHALGSICVLDVKANNLTNEQAEALQSLATQVMTKLELRKKMEHLKDTQQKLKKVNKKLKEFARIASHDMKTPLANICLLTRSFQNRYASVLDADAISMLSIIDGSSKELLSFIDDILLASSAIDDSFSKETDSEVLINKVIKLIGRPKDIEIKVSGKLPKVQMNQTSLQQVFQNLITNAIKYNDKPKGIIDISCHSNNHFHCFNIKDNGTGIDKEDVHTIFLKSQTLKKKDRYGNMGTGLGLATVKEIVENTGGKIIVDSVKNIGSVFKIFIPCKAV